MQYWLVKQEPEAYSWTDFVKDGGTAWTGVRNFSARNGVAHRDRFLRDIDHAGRAVATDVSEARHANDE